MVKEASALNLPPSWTIIVRTQQFTIKKAKVLRKRWGIKFEMPRNSRLKPCESQRPCVATQRRRAERPRRGRERKVDVGR